jgi:hypothetical protein
MELWDNNVPRSEEISFIAPISFLFLGGTERIKKGESCVGMCCNVLWGGDVM